MIVDKYSYIWYNSIAQSVILLSSYGMPLVYISLANNAYYILQRIFKFDMHTQ